MAGSLAAMQSCGVQRRSSTASAASLPRRPPPGGHVRLWQPATGGHVGFADGGFPGHVLSLPAQVLDWLAAPA